MRAIAASNLVTGPLYAVVFDRWAGISTFKGGIPGGLLALNWDLSMFAFQNSWTFPVAALDLAANIIVNIIVGGIVGAVLGRKKV